MFPFSLRERAKAWLNSLPTGSITTWDDLAQKFLSKYFPPAKTAKLRNDITTFTQEDGESLYEAWERFKDMLRKCPHHGLEVWLQVSSFYNGLHNQASLNSYQWYNPRSNRGAKQGVHSVDTVTSLSAQADALATRLNQLSKGKTIVETTKEVKKASLLMLSSRKDNNNQRQSGFGQQQQFQQRQSQNYQPRQQFQGTNKPSNGLSLEDAVTKLISTTESQALLEDAHHKQYEEKFSLHEAEFRTEKETLQSIEVQLGQISKLLSERQPGCLPNNTEPNPKANVSAITLRNSKIGNPQPINATITLADGTIKSPMGVSENLLAKVGKCVFPADFMVLEMGPDYSVPLIFGRPFLATARATIDMNEGILTLRVGKQSVAYNIEGNDSLSNDPFEIAQFIDTNLDY
ncbi:hypothetical protein L1987_16065 [Smallanthus sonchifolius]|uniref:Uncharacterized protein n=1 Tax=Smallanthus sonchifolius TaxID=185202 RepID=A0ACB9JAT3_9ASTR|nr:hypothetical protein L1987_16065 [Smallanthus sonchifolius]